MTAPPQEPQEPPQKPPQPPHPPDEPTSWLDERGQRCPMPVIALGRAAARLDPGTVVGLLADDPAAETDVPAWCRLKGGSLLGTRPAPDGRPGTAYVVRLPG